MGDEGLDFFDAHFFGVAFFVMDDVAADPIYVGLFGALGVVFDADSVGDELQEFRGLGLHVLTVAEWDCIMSSADFNPIRLNAQTI